MANHDPGDISKMTWTCNLSEEAEEQLKELPRKIQSQIAKSIDAMENDPLAGDVVALQGKQWKGLYRKRVGRYRIIFSLNHAEHSVGISAILLRSEKTYK